MPEQNNHDELVIIEGAELRAIDFDEPGPSIPGAVTRRGVYENARGQRFEVTAAAPTEDERTLETFLGALQVSYEADLVEEGPDLGLSLEEPDEELEALLRHVVELAEEKRDKDAPRGAAIALVTDSISGEGIESGSAIVISAAIDPPIGRSHCHGWKGPDGVAAEVKNGTIELGGLTYRTPVTLGPNSPRKVYDANGFCSVTGVAAQSNYGLGSKWILRWRR
jgi:hypothetical protein